MSRVLLEIEDVGKSFLIPSVRRDTVREQIFGLLAPRRFERLTVLDGVNLSVREGETLGIVGRNGSGKSTLLKIIAGIYEADRGSVHRRAGITPILELGVGWNPELNAIDNIYLLGSVLGLSLARIRHELDAILAFAELARFAELPLKHYSSGMASRLAYAVAFAAVREVLVLDEIFAVGDAGFRARCEQRYRELKAAGHTVILVTHDLRVLSTFCDRAVLLSQGRVMVDAAPQIVQTEYLARTALA
jgi:ABC-type polysaccharide/polyol phosphate transport system ATPase subunit